MLSTNVKPASSRTPATRVFLQCFMPLLLLSLGLMQSGCAVMETYMVEMRDGTLLATDVYLPSSDNDAWPVLLIRTPYGRDENEALFDFTEDYALVIQDVRGRGMSEGVFGFPDQETADGHDTLTWIAAQRWSNGATSAARPPATT